MAKDGGTSHDLPFMESSHVLGIHPGGDSQPSTEYPFISFSRPYDTSKINSSIQSMEPLAIAFDRQPAAYDLIMPSS